MEETSISIDDSKVKPRKLVSAGFLLESDNKYLIGCPSHRTGTTGGWGIPKGRQDPGETVLQTAVREFYEETNLGILSLHAKDHVLYEFVPFFSYNTEGKDDTGKFKKTVFVFRAYDIAKERFLHEQPELLKCLTFVKSGAPEIGEYKWVTADEAIDMVVKSQKPIFELVAKYNKYRKFYGSNS